VHSSTLKKAGGGVLGPLSRSRALRVPTDLWPCRVPFLNVLSCQVWD